MKGSESAVLTLKRDASGFRHYFDGKPVLCGSTLLMKWWTGERAVWMPVRYDSDLANDHCPAFLHAVLPGLHGRPTTVQLRYTPDLVLRRPQGADDCDPEVIPRYVDPNACPHCGSQRQPCGC